MVLGNAADVHRSNERGRILAVLADDPKALGPQEIAQRTGMPRNNIDQLLYKMAQDGQLAKAGRGRYRHPDHQPPGKIDKKIRNGEKCL